jgi:hypothetical protein
VVNTLNGRPTPSRAAIPRNINLSGVRIKYTFNQEIRYTFLILSPRMTTPAVIEETAIRDKTNETLRTDEDFKNMSMTERRMTTIKMMTPVEINLRYRLSLEKYPSFQA